MVGEIIVIWIWQAVIFLSDCWAATNPERLLASCGRDDPDKLVSSFMQPLRLASRSGRLRFHWFDLIARSRAPRLRAPASSLSLSLSFPTQAFLFHQFRLCFLYGVVSLLMIFVSFFLYVGHVFTVPCWDTTPTEISLQLLCNEDEMRVFVDSICAFDCSSSTNEYLFEVLFSALILLQVLAFISSSRTDGRVAQIFSWKVSFSWIECVWTLSYCWF